jgi:actin-related protein 10
LTRPKLPIDLRKPLASSIVVAGGTTLIPGFIPRLRLELLRALDTPVSPATTTDLSSSRSHRHGPRRPRATFATRFAPLASLLPHLAILNDTCSFAARDDGPSLSANAGRAPPFSPALLGWIGGSLAGALKTGGVEVLRDRWDEAGILQGDGEGEGGSEDEDDMEKEEARRRRRAACLPDWLGPLVR